MTERDEREGRPFISLHSPHGRNVSGGSEEDINAAFSCLSFCSLSLQH